jgi:hypothetical protein
MKRPNACTAGNENFTGREAGCFQSILSYYQTGEIGNDQIIDSDKIKTGL